MDPHHRQRLTAAARLLTRAEKPVRVLRHIGWSPAVAARFFEAGARELPRVRYHSWDPTHTLELVAEARRLLDARSPGSALLRRHARAIERSARMLAAVGTRAFHRHSVALYGTPDDPLLDGESTSFGLARRLDRTLGRYRGTDLGPPPPAVTPSELADALRATAAGFLGEAAPPVSVVPHLSAKVTAGAKRVRVRRNALFTVADVQQLSSHEIMIHVGTANNGKLQRRLPILAAGHAGTTRTQEGLAVFSELITGAMTPERFRRLANRVLAVQHAIDGADFLDLYRFFLDRTDDPVESFEDARRIVRGGLIDGGAPFTKDGVYLDGLLRVHNLLRALVDLHRTDLMPLLFVGRLDLEDVPDLAVLADQGMCVPPRYLPPWAVDRRFLVSYLAYSGFLNRVSLPAVRLHYARMLDGCPKGAAA